MKKLFAVLIALQLMIIPIPAAHASGIAGMANQIRGMAIAGVGATILTACPLGHLALSMKLFMAAGLVYLLGEFAAGGGQKGEIKEEGDKVEGTTKGQGGETQLATLEAQLKDKESKKKVADKRAMFTAASMALMTAAAVAAVTEIPREITGTLPPPACNPALATASGKIKAGLIGAAFSFVGGGKITGALVTGIGLYTMGLSALIGVMNSATGRIAAFGALAAFTGLALMDAKKESSKLAKEIADLKKVIAQFKKETDDPGRTTEDTTGGATAGVSGGINDGVLAGSTAGAAGGVSGGVTALPTGTSVTTSRTCISGNAEISSNCSNPLRVPALSSSDLRGSPELQQVASTGIALANDMASGSSGGKAELGAASLASSAAKLNDDLKTQLAKSNSFLKSRGAKPIDFDKEVAATVKSMNSSAQNEASKSGQSMAALGLGDAALDPNAATKIGLEINGASTGAAVALPETKGDATAVAPADPFSDPATAAAVAAAKKKSEESAKDALGKNLADYESNDNDISGNKETSLWRQVSNRYLLKYERFFERKKVEEQPAAAKPVAPQPAQ